MSFPYGLAEPFDIGDGSLNHLTREECFVLGAEWALFRNDLDQGAAFSRMVHTENAGRLIALVQRRKWTVERQELSANWTKLTARPSAEASVAPSGQNSAAVEPRH